MPVSARSESPVRFSVCPVPNILLQFQKLLIQAVHHASFRKLLYRVQLISVTGSEERYDLWDQIRKRLVV